ncbi:MAG: ATP synthase F0 subunit C [Candidatus Omnitrophica bacterium]|nr:ATP synthase F0 subunit C [Candidatus Omnitrophota bacterium]MDE2009709.1 ATP synthase F0 subunit C [Candidatus Omnitrophota bacterium]MDE2213894.1 ATP synthase F0 subunit C [Candidatus Omnitrophota bacterium]MDE2231847.1 ATP synthase F0 subunit C [Candidatus Omnitrophota bacterium]
MHLGEISAGAGLGLSAVGAGIGVGLIFAAAIQAIARQPELTNKLQTLMFIGAAIVEGVAFFCAIICFLAIK